MVVDAQKKIQLLLVQGCVVRKNAVLLIKRNEPEIPEIHGNFELPGGKVQFGEYPTDTLIREVFEETGVNVIPHYKFPNPYSVIRNTPEKQIHPVIWCFQCHYRNEQKLLFHPKKVEKSLWIPISEINPFKVQSGSLNFIRLMLASENIDLKKVAPSSFEERLVLNHKQDKHRKIVIIIKAQLKLNYVFKVKVCHGSGADLHIKEGKLKKSFSHRDDLIQFLRQTLQLRRLQGFQILSNSSRLPLIDPLRTNNSSNIKSLQLSLF